MDDKSTRTILRFRYGQASASELQEVANEIIAELAQGDSAAVTTVRDAGVDPAVASKAIVTIDEEGEGAEPVLTTVVVGIAVSAGANVAKRLWDDVIWPRIKYRLGARAVGSEVAQPGSDDGS